MMKKCFSSVPPGCCGEGPRSPTVRGAPRCPSLHRKPASSKGIPATLLGREQALRGNCLGILSSTRSLHSSQECSPPLRHSAQALASRRWKDGCENAPGRFPAPAGRKTAQRVAGSIPEGIGLPGPIRAGGSWGGGRRCRRQPGREDTLVLKSDPITFATDAVGYYAMVVNANDLATCGAKPRWMLATLLSHRGPGPAKSARSWSNCSRPPPNSG